MKRFLFFLACINSFLISQVKTGIISGEVRDAVTKQPLPGAIIILEGTNKGSSCDINGYYVIKNVEPGKYILKSSLIGYDPFVNTEVSVIPNRNLTINFELNATTVELEQISISADYFSKPLENPTSIRTLTPEEIKRSPGSAEDIFRVMQSLPGVATAGAKSAQLIVRGGSPNENLTLLDNIEVYNPIHFARTGESMGIISIVNPSLLQKVDFLTGGFPVSYGDKMSSVFDMSLREGNREVFNSDVNLNFAGFGVMFDGPLFENSNAVLSLRRGFFDLITATLNKPAAPSYYDAVGKISYDINKDNRISFVGFYYLDQIEKTGKVSDANSTLNKFDYLTRDDFGSAFGINLRTLLTDNSFSIITASVTKNGWNTLQGTETNKTLMGEDISENELSLRSELNYQVSSFLSLKVGGQIKSISSLNESWTPEDTLRTGVIVPASIITFKPDASTKSAIFLQSTLHFFESIALTLGLRQDYFELTNENKISPRISLSYNLTDVTALNLAWGKFFQTPASYQIAPDERNLELNSSNAIHYILGLEHRLNYDTKGTIEIYYKKLSDLIVDPDSSNLLLNTGSGYSQGIEFSLQKKFTEGFVGSASYSYSISKRRDEENLNLYNFEYDRPHIINLIGGLELSSGWQIGLKFQFASGNPYTPIVGVISKNNSFYLIEGEKNSQRYPDYHKIDLRIDKQFIFSNWSFSLYLDLWNLYNRDNVTGYSFKAEKDGNITVTPRYDFGITPIFGMTAKF